MLHVYRIEDGEVHHYAAESRDDALAAYHEDYGDVPTPDTCVELADDQPLTIHIHPDDDELRPAEPFTRPAREWAAETGRGLVCSTVR